VRLRGCVRSGEAVALLDDLAQHRFSIATRAAGSWIRSSADSDTTRNPSFGSTGTGRPPFVVCRGQRACHARQTRTPKRAGNRMVADLRPQIMDPIPICSSKHWRRRGFCLAYTKPNQPGAGAPGLHRGLDP
jgi:hypothetical protein